MNRKSMLNMVLVAGLLSPAFSALAGDHESVVHDLPGKLRKFTTTQKVMFGASIPPFAFLAVSLYSLLHNEPSANFKPKGEWKKLLDAKLLAQDPKAYAQNAYDVYWYRWVGQYFKDNKLKLNAEGDPKMSRKKFPHGILGWAHTHIYVLKKTSDWIGGLATTVTPVLALFLLADKLKLIGFKENAGAQPSAKEQYYAFKLAEKQAAAQRAAEQPQE